MSKLLAAFIALSACTGRPDTSLEGRMRRQLGVPFIGREVRIRESLLGNFTPGTFHDEVLARLQRAGVGSDGLSVLRDDRGSRVIDVRVKDDAKGLVSVTSDVAIRFRFDALDRLVDIEVEVLRTGL